jgi:hypothetical protein
MLPQISYSAAEIRRVRRIQFGVLSPEEIVRTQWRFGLCGNGRRWEAADVCSGGEVWLVTRRVVARRFFWALTAPVLRRTGVEAAAAAGRCTHRPLRST